MTPTDSQAARLLPCPFCGNDVNDDEGCFPCGPKYWEVRCGNPECFAHDPVRSTREEAITAWNTRPREGAGTVDQSIPMDPGPWRASDDGKDVFSEHFAVDAALRISGDFIDDHHRKDYAVWLARTLNNAALAAALGKSNG